MNRTVASVPSVSLVPAVCCQAQSRERHARAWTLAVLATALLVAGLFATRAASRRSLNELAARLSYAETGRAAIQQQLDLARRDQKTLSARMLVLAGLDRPQHWPRRLAEMLAVTPDEVVLTNLRVEPINESSAPAKASPASAPASSGSRDAVGPEPSHLVRVSGQAASNEVLQRFVSGLRESGSWDEVSMQQLTIVDGATAGWLTFELECRPREIQR